MPEFRKVCDVYQGYNYKKDKQTTVGYITAMNVGGTDLAVDQTTCKDPTSPDTDLANVAVVSDVLWEIGQTDAVYFSCQFSVYNKLKILELIYKSMQSVLVTFQFTIYEYDKVAKKYFKCFHCEDTTMNGIIEKNGEELNMSVSEDRSMQVESPENYAFQIGIKPQPTAQSLTIATADTKNVVKPWGVTVTAS